MSIYVFFIRQKHVSGGNGSFGFWTVSDDVKFIFMISVVVPLKLMICNWTQLLFGLWVENTLCVSWIWSIGMRLILVLFLIRKNELWPRKKWRSYCLNEFSDNAYSDFHRLLPSRVENSFWYWVSVGVWLNWKPTIEKELLAR